MHALPRSFRAGGFTLIELLIVIAIIAILIGLLFPAFKGVQDQAKRTQAKNDLTQIVTAVNAYYTEYGKYPVYYATPPATVTDSDFSNSGASVINGGDTFTNMGDNSLVVDALRNNLSATGTNLTKVANTPKSGVAPTTSTLPGTWYDPWGNPYRIRIDTGYNNMVDGPYAANAGTTSTNPNVSGGVIAWSIGTDGQTSSTDKKVGTADDDVISWQ